MGWRGCLDLFCLSPGGIGTPLAMLAICLALVLEGPGRVSLDALFRIESGQATASGETSRDYGFHGLKRFLLLRHYSAIEREKEDNMPDFGSGADKLLEIASKLPTEDFVKFTTGLVRNVTEALHESNREQLTEYIKLVDAVAGTLAEFETKTFGNLDTAARDYLNNVLLPVYAGDDDSKVLEEAEVTSNEAIVLVSDADKRKTLAMIFDGIKLPLSGVDKTFEEHVSNDQIEPRALLDFAKAELRRTAKQSYGELKALVQMGIMRIFPESVLLRTTLLFEAESKDSSSTSTNQVVTERENRSLDWGLNGSASYSRNRFSQFLRSSFAAAISGRVSSSTSSSKLKVTTVDTKSSSNLDAKIQLTGFVEIKMKTDYFPQLPQQTTPAITA